MTAETTAFSPFNDIPMSLAETAVPTRNGELVVTVPTDVAEPAADPLTTLVAANLLVEALAMDNLLLVVPSDAFAKNTVVPLDAEVSASAMIVLADPVQ